MNALIKTKHSDLNDITDEILRRYLLMKQGLTREAYSKRLDKFFTWLYLREDQQIRPDTLQEYKMYLEAKNLKTTSINAYLTPLKDFFKWCFNMDYMHMDVGKYLKLSTQGNKELTQARALTNDEVVQLIKATNKDTPKDHAQRIMLICLFNLGLRISEVMRIQLHDLDLIKGIVKVNGKGSKVRVLGISDALKGEIENYLSSIKDNLQDHDYLIQSFRGPLNAKPCTSQYGNKVLKEVALRANLDLTDVRSHSGRVTAINHLLDKEVSMRDVANFAGHVNINTTRRYDRKDQERIIQTCNIIKFE